MKKKLYHTIKNFFEHKAIVLMYHRIAAPESDVWEIAVSPERFEQQLQVLKKMGNIVPLQQLSNDLNNQRLSKNKIAITFDDGYFDNFSAAKPLLEKYGLPATFFITSGNIESNKEFWWDELEQYILFAENLPLAFSMLIRESPIEAELKSESSLNETIRQRHRSWKACMDAPPTCRAQLFYTLWEQLRPMPFEEQQMYLQKIRNWANIPLTTRADYRPMSVMELKQLAAVNLFTIGAHTVNHPAMAYQTTEFQRKELTENRKFLQKTTGKEINLLAYPYGNYNNETIIIAENLNFTSAFTTEEKVIRKQSHQFKLGRFQVKNLTGDEFSNQLNQWRTQ